MQLVGFQMLSADELSKVDKMISKSLGATCEGEGFELSNGLVYTKEKYNRHGYIFQNKEELNVYCTEWVGKQYN